MVHIPGVTQLLDREDELTLLEESELFDNVIDHMGQFLINVLEGVDVQFTYEKNCICKSSCYKKDNAYMQLICLAQPVDTFFSFCICIYIIGQRLKHYFANPLTTHTELIDKDTVQFPAVLFCRFGFTRYLTNGFLEEVKAKCKLENDCKTLSLDGIKQYPLETLNLSVEKYWDDYGIGIHLIDNMVYCKYMTHPSKDCRGEHAVESNMTLKRTILGTCVEHYLG
uniref:Uncharacterized protein n=1 Tax=Strigamia maritima TaxID=126957 RepID=T1IS68_STRMM